MKLQPHRPAQFGTVLVLLTTLTAGIPCRALVADLAQTATGFGLLPVETVNQGSAAGIADGTMFSWFHGANSPRNFSITNLQPYMTWTSAQPIRSVRIWFDATNVNPPEYDRLVIDQLTGGSPAVEGNWSTVYDTGTGLGQKFLDVDLGNTISTTGLRVRAFKSTEDVNVGEVAVFAPFGGAHPGGTLTGHRVFPDSVTASSSEYRAASLANNADWYDGGWLSATAAANPDPDFAYDLFFTDATLNALSLTWSAQGGFSVIPSQWELLVDTGSGLSSLGTYTTSTAQNGATRGQYYYDLGRLEGVDQVRVRVAESDLVGGNRVGLIEFETFLTVPEPASAGLLALGALIAWAASRRRA